MLRVNFYDGIDDDLLKFAVIISSYKGKWVFCKHKERNTYECPGGHREEGEDILTTAKRELHEETGAVEYEIKPICVYSVVGNDGVIENEVETFGMLYHADIAKFEGLPDLEMEKVAFFHSLPENLTYPEIQTILFQKVINTICNGDEMMEELDDDDLLSEAARRIKSPNKKRVSMNNVMERFGFTQEDLDNTDLDMDI